MTDLTPPSRGLPAILLSLTLGAIAIGGGFYRVQGEAPSVGLEATFWEPEAELVKAYLVEDGRLLEQYPELEGERELMKAYQEANLLAGAPRTGENIPEYRKTLTQLEAQSSTFFRQHGALAFRAAGLRAWHRMAEALRTSDQAEQRAFGGDMSEELDRAGLRENGEWKSGAWVVLRMLYVYRWSRLIHQAAPGDVVLHPLERRTIPAWKAEAHGDSHSPKLEARLQYAAEAGALDASYPTPFVQGILYARYGFMDQALPLLKRGIDAYPELSIWAEQIGRLEAQLSHP